MSWSVYFDGWAGPIRVLSVSVLAYISLILLLRVSGKRTLSKMNAFDSVVTFALGSTLATILLSRDVPLFDGVLALALLIFFQYAVAWLSVRSSTFGGIVKSRPSLLMYRGQFYHDVMRRERVTKEEVLAAIRESRFASIENVEAVVLETAGTVTVLQAVEQEEPTALGGVGNKPEEVLKSQAA